jgi:hypothetical protein
MTICRGAPCGYPHRCGVSTRRYPYRLLVGFGDRKFNNSIDLVNVWVLYSIDPTYRSNKFIDLMTICRGISCGYPHRCGVSTRHYPYRLLVGFGDRKFNNSIDLVNVWVSHSIDSTYRSIDLMTTCRGAPCGYPHRCGVSTRHYPLQI